MINTRAVLQVKYSGKFFNMEKTGDQTSESKHKKIDEHAQGSSFETYLILTAFVKKKMVKDSPVLQITNLYQYKNSKTTQKKK